MAAVAEKTQNINLNAPSTSYSTTIPFGEPQKPKNFQFVAPKWFYQDPSMLEQGPFTSEQMHGWYKEGFFPSSLPIKCAGDVGFIPLYQFVGKYGEQQPFLEAVRDQEAMERDHYMKEMNRNNGFIPFGQRPGNLPPKMPFVDHHGMGYARVPQDQPFRLPSDPYGAPQFQQQMPFMYNRNLGALGVDNNQFQPVNPPQFTNVLQQQMPSAPQRDFSFSDILPKSPGKQSEFVHNNEMTFQEEGEVVSPVAKNSTPVTSSKESLTRTNHFSKTCN